MSSWDLAFIIACFTLGYCGTMLVVAAIINRDDIANWFSKMKRRIFK